MNPILQRINSHFKQPFDVAKRDPWYWKLSKPALELDIDLYRPLVSSHLVLRAEYNLLGQTIRHCLPSPIELDTAFHYNSAIMTEGELVEHLVAAVLIAQLLEQLYLHYLIVPREVKELIEQRRKYIQVLSLIRPDFATWIINQSLVNARGFSNEVQRKTLDINLYRLIIIRSKRAFDLIAAIPGIANWYRGIVRYIDMVMDPILPHLGWFFYLPRLLVNLYLLSKHTFPIKMNEHEKNLGWWLRLKAQLKQRWFELGNDFPWVLVGFINCFVLVGVLAPIAMYLAIAFFTYDVPLAAIRALIQRHRLCKLRDEYRAMALSKDYQHLDLLLQSIDEQIRFETLQFGTHVLSTVAISLAMWCGAPVFAAVPVVPIIGAVCLVLICIINFAREPILVKQRPRSMIEVIEKPIVEPPVTYSEPRVSAKYLSTVGAFAVKSPAPDKELEIKHVPSI